MGRRSQGTRRMRMLLRPRLLAGSRQVLLWNRTRLWRPGRQRIALCPQPLPHRQRRRLRLRCLLCRRCLLRRPCLLPRLCRMPSTVLQINLAFLRFGLHRASSQLAMPVTPP